MVYVDDEYEDSEVDKEFAKWLWNSTHCPYCDATFFNIATVEETETARIKHIKSKHPEKRFTIGD